MHTRLLKLVIVISVALMFSLIAFNNMIDYCTNFQLVKSVLSMDSITATNVKWRAVLSPLLQHGAYLFIITWEILTAIFCWAGAVQMLRDRGSGRTIATAGLTMGFALFMFGFVIIAGEWFYLWDSLLKSMHEKALLFALLLACFAYFVSTEDDKKL